MKKGFTFFETLAVITVIVLIGLITIPAISNNLETNRKKLFAETIEQIVESVKIYRTENGLTAQNVEFDIKNNPNIEYSKKSKIKGGKVKIEDSTYKIINISNEEYCANGTLDNLIITDGACKTTASE